MKPSEHLAAAVPIYWPLYHLPVNITSRLGQLLHLPHPAVNNVEVKLTYHTRSRTAKGLALSGLLKQQVSFNPR